MDVGKFIGCFRPAQPIRSILTQTLSLTAGSALKSILVLFGLIMVAILGIGVPPPAVDGK